MSITYESREAWGAKPPKSNPGPFTDLVATVMHYTANAQGYAVPGSGDHERCRNQVRGIQNYHQSIPDQSDIEYSHLGCNHGVVFQGRATGIKTGANGSAETNRTMPSFCMLMGVGDRPSEALYEAAGWWHAQIEARAGHTLEMKGHRDIYSTSCPGDAIYPWVTSGGYRKSPPPPPNTGEDVMHFIGAYQNAQWIIAGDLSSRTVIASEADLQALLASGRFIVLTFSDAQMDVIPEVTA